MSDFTRLHAATVALRQKLTAWLGELVPPYADEVLHDLEEATAEPGTDPGRVRYLVAEAEGVMEMLPHVPDEWQPVADAADAAGIRASA